MKKQYYTTPYTKANDVVLVIVNTSDSIVESWCEGRSSLNKRIRERAFDGYYFNAELTQLK